MAALLIGASLILIPRLTTPEPSPSSASRIVLVQRARINLSNCAGPAIGCDRPFVYNVAIGFGSAWINAGRDLIRIDLATNRMVRLDAGSIGLDLADFPTAIEDVAMGDDGVWIWHTTAARDEAVSRLDPATNRRVATIPLGSFPTRLKGHGDRPVLVGEGFVWGIKDGGIPPGVNTPAPPRSFGEVYRIDPRTDRIKGSLSVNSLIFAVGEGSFWYVDEVRGLIRVDPQLLTGDPVPDTPVEVNGLAAGADAVWLTTGDPHLKGNGSLIRVDPTTDRVVKTISLSAGGPVVVRNGVVWFIDFANGSELTWLDASTNRIIGRVSVPTRGPVDLAVGERTVWVTSMNDAVTYRFDISYR